MIYNINCYKNKISNKFVLRFKMREEFKILFRFQTGYAKDNGRQDRIVLDDQLLKEREEMMLRKKDRRTKIV